MFVGSKFAHGWSLTVFRDPLPWPASHMFQNKSCAMDLNAVWYGGCPEIPDHYAGRTDMRDDLFVRCKSRLLDLRVFRRFIRLRRNL